jgi:hypothetical protein
LLKENDELRREVDEKIEDARINRFLLNQERKSKKDLVNEQANYYSKRNQLEELFLECVEEVRKDIHRRKASSIGMHGDLTGSLKPTKESKSFTATDKRKVLDLLLSNENVLLFLYEKLFPRPLAQGKVFKESQAIFADLDVSPKRLRSRSKNYSSRPENHRAGKPIKFHDVSMKDSQAMTGISDTEHETRINSSSKNIMRQSANTSKPMSAFHHKRP